MSKASKRRTAEEINSLATVIKRYRMYVKESQNGEWSESIEEMREIMTEISRAFLDRFPDPRGEKMARSQICR